MHMCTQAIARPVPCARASMPQRHAIQYTCNSRPRLPALAAPPPPLAHLFDPEPDELVELIVQLGTVPAVVPLLTLGDVEEMPSAG